MVDYIPSATEEQVSLFIHARHPRIAFERRLRRHPCILHKRQRAQLVGNDTGIPYFRRELRSHESVELIAIIGIHDMGCLPCGNKQEYNHSDRCCHLHKEQCLFPQRTVVATTTESIVYAHKREQHCRYYAGHGKTCKANKRGYPHTTGSKKVRHFVTQEFKYLTTQTKYCNSCNNHRCCKQQHCLHQQHAEDSAARCTVALHCSNGAAALCKSRNCEQHIIEASHNKSYESNCGIESLHLPHITADIYGRCQRGKIESLLPLLAMLGNTMFLQKSRHGCLNLGNVGTGAQLYECRVAVLPGPYFVIAVVREIFKNIEITYRLVCRGCSEYTGNNHKPQFLAQWVLITEHFSCKPLRNHHLIGRCTLTTENAMGIATDYPKIEDIEKSAVRFQSFCRHQVIGGTENFFHLNEMHCSLNL